MLIAGAGVTQNAATATAASSSTGRPILPKGDGGWSSNPQPPGSTFAWKAPAGHTAEHPAKTDPHAKRVKELTTRRTADASFFQMSDGSVQEELSAAPVHYQDAHGVWQNIDTTVRQLSHNGFTAGAVGDTFQTYFSGDAGSLVRLEQGGAFVQIGADGATVPAPKVSGNSVTYKDAYPGTDLTYQSGPQGVKESIVLAKAPAAGASFSFTVKIGALTPKQLADGAIALYGGESADPVFTIPAPYMADSKPDANSPYGLAYSADVKQSMTFDAKTGTLHVTVTPDASWLADAHRAYPVTIDPTIDVAPTPSQAQNVMILADGPTTNYSTSWRLSVGTTTTGAARALIKFPMPTIPAGTTITSADLDLYYDQTFTTGSNTVPMEALAANAAWSPTTATWNTASSIGGPVAGTTSMTANALAVWNDFPVTSTVQGWLNGTATNNGFVLRATNETTLGQGGPRYEGSIYAYNGEVVNAPKLIITYGVPGIALNPPTVIHSTGAELSWPTYTNTTGNSGNDLAEYQIHRSVYQTFTPGASTEISPVASGSTSFVDSTAAPTPANNSDPYGNAYYYMVVVKTKNGTLIPGPTALVRLPEAGRTTLIIPVQSATTLSSSEPTTVLNTLSNAGTPQPWLEVGDNSPTYGTAHSVFNFPALTAVPAGSTVLDAHLKLWQETTSTGTSGAVYELHPLTRAFTGSQATWNSAATGTAWTKAGGDYNATADGTVSGLTNDPNRQNLDATAIVQGWVNTPSSDDGLLVKLSSESGTSPQEHTIFAGPATAEKALAPELVVTYLDTSTSSTYYAPATPTGMNQGTTYTVPVTVNNTTAGNWAASNEVLTYHWTLPDGTDVTNSSNQLQTALPADLAPAGTTTVNAQVTPPAPTNGNQLEHYTLAWDMYNKSTATYLSAGTGGIGSLNQQTGVAATGNNQLGLEQFYPYTTTPTGSGSSLYTNDASGNTVWNDDLFSNPSVGFQTFLRLNYNSLDTTDTDTGFGWSIQASAPTRLGQALGFYPPGNPTAVVLDDGTGNSHQWNYNSTSKTWISPPGVHLYLQELDPNCGPKVTDSRAWSMTKPDRTTFYFDCEGYPTAEVDANGNEADYTYSSRQSQNKPEEFLQYITDPSGIQTLNLNYYTKGGSYSYIDSTGTLQTATNLTNPAIIDHVSSITDVSGRTVDFYYTTQGLLARIVDGAGTSIAKTFKFTYDATQGTKNVKMTAVQDPRGNTTNVAYYPTSSPTKWWTQQIGDRLGHTTGFGYVQPSTYTGALTQTTVTDGNTNNWVYQSDSSGRMIEAVNPSPLNQATKLTWDNDNNVATLTEANGAQSQWTYDQNTGYPLTYKDPVTVAANGSATTNYVYNFSLNGHVADLSSVTSAAGRMTTYTHDGNGNVLTSVAPDGNVTGAAAGSYTTSYTYATNGEMLTVKDADGHTTTYSYTHLVGPGVSVPEFTGKPDSVTDALGQNTTDFAYGPRGELTSSTDPLGHTSSFTYDVFLRPTGSQVPKDSSSNTDVITPAPVYDGNDNITQSTAQYLTGYPTNAITYTAYDKDDEKTSVSLPTNASTSVSRVDSYTYDNVGNQLTATQPLGNASGATAGSYTTTSTYDAANELSTVKDAVGDLTSYGYDNVGNKTSVKDPLTYVSQMSYDLDHRPIGTKDATGATTSVTYDADGVKLATTDQNNNITNYSVDANSLVLQTQVPHINGGGSSIIYDTTQYTYDQVGNNTSVISPRGVASGPAGAYTTSSVYDADNHLTKALGAYLPGDATYGQTTQPETDYTYDADGRMTKVDRITQPSATSQQIAGQTPPADNAVTNLSYYDNGWTKSSTDPFNINTAYDYNGLGEQISRTVTSSDGADGNSATGAASRYMNWDYYPDGSLQAYTDTGMPAGWRNQVVTADGQGNGAELGWRQTQAGNGYNGSSYYQCTQGCGQNQFFWNLAFPANDKYTVYVWYSAAGDNNAQYTVNYGGGSQTVTVDQTKNVGSWVPLGEFSFNAGSSGQSVGLLDGNSSGGAIADSVRIVRDDSGNTQPGSNHLAYTYDVNGNATAISDTSPGAQYSGYAATYDQAGRLQQMLENSGTTLKHTLTYGYDSDSELTSQGFDGTSGGYSYNNLNQLTQVVDKQSSTDAGITTAYSYTPTGQLATETKGNANKVTDTYNLDGTLASTAEVTATGTTVDQHQLNYDPNNNISQDTATLQSANTGAPTLTNTATLTYDPNNQVTGVSNSNNHDNQTYQYDSSGNVIEQSVGGNAANFVYTHGRLYAQESGNQLTGTYQYDALGRLSEIVGGYTVANATVGETYNYDGFDNILSQSQSTGTAANTTSYKYDSLNRPITETITPNSGSAQTDAIDYLGSTKTVADEQIAAGGDTITKTYDYSPNGERLALINNDQNNSANDNTAYYTYDQHKNVEALTGAVGSTLATYGYTAFGADDKTSSSDTNSWDTGLDANSDSTAAFPFNSYRFNSARIATTTGNLDMGARTYDPNINSFVSRDAYSGAGANTSLTTDPYNASSYAFAGGNPISNVEQDGHGWKSFLGGIEGAAYGYGLCNLALDGETAGGGALICAGIIGAGAGIGAQAGTCAEGGSCSPAAFAENATINAVAGIVTAGAADALDGLLPSVLKGATSAAAGGATGYGLGCSAAQSCSWSGLAEATAFSAGVGALFGSFAGCGGESFTADTKVQLADGSSKAISSLKPGEKVKSTDTKSGKTKGSSTSAVLVNHDTDLYDLTVHTVQGEQVVHTTAHHLFFDKTTHSWVEAAKLHKGDELTTDDGTTVRADGGKTPAVSAGDMWDLTVPDDHDFYVMAADTPVLVHNCGVTSLNSSETEMSPIALKARMENGISSGRNVAVYRIGSGDDAYYLAAASVKGVGHSETIIDAYIDANGINPDDVTGIYSERQPCDGPYMCGAKIGRYKNAANDIWWSLNPDFSAGNSGRILTMMNNYSPRSDLPGYTWVN